MGEIREQHGRRKHKNVNKFPMTILRYFNDHLGEFGKANKLLYSSWAEGTWPGKPGNLEILKKHYVN